ncbi:MAG: hypothetical protein P8X96_18700 [Desulfobacteraceae bacterium]
MDLCRPIQPQLLPFVADTYTISVAAGADGSISPSSTVVSAGGSQTFIISAAANYHIADVRVDGNSVGPVGSYTFSGVNGNHTLSASFAVDTHTITVSSGANGSISPSTTTVNAGGSQTFTISAAANYHIADVRVDGNSVGAVSSYTFSGVNGDHTLSASFAADTHTITVSAGDDGSISPSTTTVNAGGSQTFTISAAANYHIADVRVDGNSVGAVSSYTFTGVNGDHTLSASFAADTHTITVSSGANGSISPSTTTINAGGSQTFTISAAANYHIADVRVDGNSVGAVSSYTFTGVNGDHTLSASFAADTQTHTITVSSGANGNISPSTSTVSAGSSQTFAITSDPDCQIVDVLVDGQSMGEVTSYTFQDIRADHTISATFKSNADSRDVSIWIEAEDGDIFAPMEIAGAPDASAEGYIWAPEGSGKFYKPSDDGGRAEYRFDVPSEGDYVVWGRVFATDGGSDSFYVSVDGSDQLAWHTKQSESDRWTWDVVSLRRASDDRNASNPLVYHLEAGLHTITFEQREDGTRLDRILVTNKLSLTAVELEMMLSGEEVNIWIEAEEGDIAVPMEIAGSPDASAEGYIWAPEGSGKFYKPSDDGGRAEYRFDIPSDGSYVVWGRVLATDGGSDSFYVSVDGSDQLAWHTKQSENDRWTWDVVSLRRANDDRNASNPLVHHLKAGTHTITFEQREDGTRLDRILVTNQLNLTAAELD